MSSAEARRPVDAEDDRQRRRRPPPAATKPTTRAAATSRDAPGAARPPARVGPPPRLPGGDVGPCRDGRVAAAQHQGDDDDDAQDRVDDRAPGRPRRCPARARRGRRRPVVTATRLVMRPSRRATSARSSTPKPRAGAAWAGSRMPPRRNTATKARAAVSDHTTVWSRATGTPSSDARSACRRWPGWRRRRRCSAGTGPTSDHHDGRDHEGQQVVGVEGDRADLRGWRRTAAAMRSGDERAVPQPRQQQRHGRQHLAEADGGDGDEQAGRPGEPADDDPLGGGAQRPRPTARPASTASGYGHARLGEQQERERPWGRSRGRPGRS